MDLISAKPEWLVGGGVAALLLLVWAISRHHAAHERKLNERLKRQLIAPVPPNVAHPVMVDSSPSEAQNFNTEDILKSDSLVYFLRRFRLGAPVSTVLSEAGWDQWFKGHTREIIREFQTVGLLEEVSGSTAINVTFGVGELKKIAKGLGLKVGGRKHELIARIQAASSSALALPEPLSDWLQCSPKADALLEKFAAELHVKEDREARERQRNSLKQIRASGLTKCVLLTANVEDGCCDRALAFEGKTVSIDTAPELPIRGCTARKCLCIWAGKSDYG